MARALSAAASKWAQPLSTCEKAIAGMPNKKTFHGRTHGAGINGVIAHICAIVNAGQHQIRPIAQQPRQSNVHTIGRRTIHIPKSIGCTVHVQRRVQSQGIGFGTVIVLRGHDLHLHPLNLGNGLVQGHNTRGLKSIVVRNKYFHVWLKRYRLPIVGCRCPCPRAFTLRPRCNLLCAPAPLLKLPAKACKFSAQRRLPPTPENYQAVYEEVAGLLRKRLSPQRRLRQHSARCCPPETPRQKQLTQAFLQAVEAKDWLQLQTAVVEYAQLELTGSAQATVLSCPAPPIEVLPASLAEQLARLIENTVGAVGPRRPAHARDFAAAGRFFCAKHRHGPRHWSECCRNYSFRLSFLSQNRPSGRTKLPRWWA